VDMWTGLVAVFFGAYKYERRTGLLNEGGDICNRDACVDDLVESFRGFFFFREFRNSAFSFLESRKTF